MGWKRGEVVPGASQACGARVHKQHIQPIQSTVTQHSDVYKQFLRGRAQCSFSFSFSGSRALRFRGPQELKKSSSLQF